ncbi:hypothetical protein LOTGIDRAFT_164519 [Lottia gigantea]|uniref:Uncharacterized protein n=1 Tax=Lottia gigantea TaxID=225164 RepID=V4BMM2_LOTGI|nr:hypothetical protein LOTGIDRAFT_164519 [Lottia gigantea]ESO90204.1 hypothetical protein LOTGIDRAFT_164519 [Lottia gigantea]
MVSEVNWIQKSTPLHSGFSPAELLFGRKLRTQVPVSPRELIPNWSHLSLVREREEIYRAKTKCNFDKRHKVNRLKDLEPEQNVFIRDSKSHGTIVKKHRSPRSYIVNTSKGCLRRNRSNLVPCESPRNQDLTYNDIEDFEQQEVTNESTQKHTRFSDVPQVNSFSPLVENNSSPVVKNKFSQVLRKSKRKRKPVKRLITEI